MNYQTNGTGASAINPVWEQDYLLSISKEQERIAIRGILQAMKSNDRACSKSSKEWFVKSNRSPACNGWYDCFNDDAKWTESDDDAHNGDDERGHSSILYFSIYYR